LKVLVLVCAGFVGWSVLLEAAPPSSQSSATQQDVQGEPVEFQAAVMRAGRLNGDVIVANYCAAARRQDEIVRGASMEVEISGSLPKLQKQGKLHALRHITRLGRITYEAFRFQGDNTIKKEVINRYLEQEAQTLGDASIAVTPENYKFKFKGTAEVDGRDTYVLQVSPRKKRQKLYKGEIWIDAATYLPVRESGRLVKTPMGVRTVTFVRQYGIENGIAVPRRLESETEVWFFGKAKLTVDYAHFSVDSQHTGEDLDQ
jgi:Outer membrane lipoprotein-sorting protein